MIASTNTDRFMAEWWPEKAYLIGYALADGSVVNAKDGTAQRSQVSFEAKDREPIEIALRVFPTNCRIVKYARHGGFVYRLRLSGQHVVDAFMDHGINPRKSLTATMPPMPERMRFHFMRGLLDGDGCITVRPGAYANRSGYIRLTVELSTGSVSFAQQVADLYGGTVRRTADCFRVTWDCGPAHDLLRKVYLDSEGCRMSRKFETWQRAAHVKYRTAA